MVAEGSYVKQTFTGHKGWVSSVHWLEEDGEWIESRKEMVIWCHTWF